jgi:hypothetical protein
MTKTNAPGVLCPLVLCTAKGVQAADEMLHIANNLQRG